MEFLVRAENRMPPDHPGGHRDELRRTERARAAELRAAHPQERDI
jgi:muconolactone D-isomerase